MPTSSTTVTEAQQFAHSQGNPQNSIPPNPVLNHFLTVWTNLMRGFLYVMDVVHACFPCMMCMDVYKSRMLYEDMYMLYAIIYMLMLWCLMISCADCIMIKKTKTKCTYIGLLQVSSQMSCVDCIQKLLISHQVWEKLHIKIMMRALLWVKSYAITKMKYIMAISC